jgi:hypothetical protein
MLFSRISFRDTGKMFHASSKGQKNTLLKGVQLTSYAQKENMHKTPERNAQKTENMGKNGKMLKTKLREMLSTYQLPS